MLDPFAPLDSGVEGHLSNSRGIGGLIKVRPEDFRVTEDSRPPNLDTRGRFTVVKVTLVNWETNRFVNKLAKILRISRSRIWFAGTKDKHAVTEQIMVIDAPTKKVSSVILKDVSIEILGRTHQKIGLGSHAGNRFAIVVRGCVDEDGNPLTGEEAINICKMIQLDLDKKCGNGMIPNWTGPQRFGATRPVTAAVGKKVIEGDFKGAVDLYIGMKATREEEEAAKFREMWRNGVDAATALEASPKRLDFESDMLRHLVKNEGDYIGAFKKLPNNLQLMMIHALQSLAFNKILGKRVKKGLPLHIPVIGDVVSPLDDKKMVESENKTVVEEQTLDRITRNTLLGRLVVTGALPGSETSPAEKKPLEIELEVLQEMGLEKADWKVDKIPRLTTSGNRRRFVSPYSEFLIEEATPLPEGEGNDRWLNGPVDGDRWHPDGVNLKFRFKLTPGTYATTLLREFMHSPNHQYS